MKHKVIFPDKTEVTINDKRFFSHAVILQMKADGLNKEAGQWFVFSLHKNCDLAAKKRMTCINTFSLRGEKSIDWFSAKVVAIR